MARITNTPTPCFWNFVGASIFIGTLAVGYTIIRGNVVEMELAQYKLKTGSALNRVRRVVSNLEVETQTIPIAKTKKRAIADELSESNLILEQAQQEIEQETSKFVNSEIEQ